jgi:hypothetical protein
VSEEVRAEAQAHVPGPSEASASEASEAAASEAPAPAGRPAGPQTHWEAFVSGGAYGVLAVGGAAIGLMGSFYHAVEVGPVPVLAIVFAVLNLVAFQLAGWAMATRLGAVVPALAWLLVVIFLSSRRPEGDLVISASAAGYVFLLGGSIAAAVAVARTRSPRPWLLPP